MTIVIYGAPGSSNGNQLTLPNRSSNTTEEALISPVSNAELAEFLGVESTDPMLPGLIATATQAFIDFTNNAGIEREWLLELDFYPQVQAPLSGLVPLGGEALPWIDVPLYPVTEVTSVTRGETELPDDQWDVNFRSRPARIYIQPMSLSAERISVVYRAGYELTSDFANIPPQIKTGILMYASFLYEHRGTCEIGSVGKDSGAESVWHSLKMYVGGL